MPEPRTQFGFPRTTCDCFECTLNCKAIPGYLVPDDLGPLFQAHNTDNLPLESWVKEYLLASPGALVGTAAGIRRIPTLVPARKEDGSCKFLDKDDHCRVHGDSPFGCAFFDAHQSKAESDTRSKAGLVSIMNEMYSANSTYHTLWRHLWEAGKRSQPPEDLRQRLTQLYVLAKAEALVKDKRKQGWTKKDFAEGLKQMFDSETTQPKQGDSQ